MEKIESRREWREVAAEWSGARIMLSDIKRSFKLRETNTNRRAYNYPLLLPFQGITVVACNFGQPDIYANYCIEVNLCMRVSMETDAP
jgi:hypothetical protein